MKRTLEDEVRLQSMEAVTRRHFLQDSPAALGALWLAGQVGQAPAAVPSAGSAGVTSFAPGSAA